MISRDDIFGELLSAAWRWSKAPGSKLVSLARIGLQSYSGVRFTKDLAEDPASLLLCLQDASGGTH